MARPRHRGYTTAMLLPLILATAALAQDPGQTDRLMRDLAIGDWNRRIHAVHELEFLGIEGREGLSFALGDADWQVRMAAAYSLGPLGAAGVKLLKATLRRDPCPVVRLVALHTLGGLVSGDKEIAAITSAYNDTPEELNSCPDHKEPGRLSAALAQAKRASPAPVAKAAGAGSPSAKTAKTDPGYSELDAILTSASQPNDTAIVPPSRQGPDLELGKRLQASPERLQLGAPPTHEIPVSAQPELGSPEARSRPARELAGRQAASAERLELGPPPGHAASPATAAAVVEPDAGTGRHYDPIPELLATLKRGDSRARARAADELGQRRAESAVKPLLEALSDKDRRVRSSAALALGNIGPAAGAAVPRLVKALSDPSIDVRQAAALALSRIGTSDAREGFQRYLLENVRAGR